MMSWIMPGSKSGASSTSSLAPAHVFLLVAPDIGRGAGAPRVPFVEGGPQQQAREPRFGEGVVEIAAGELFERHVGVIESRLTLEPELLEGLVEPLLAAEVVADELRVDARALGNLVHARACESLR